MILKDALDYSSLTDNVRRKDRVFAISHFLIPKSISCLFFFNFVLSSSNNSSANNSVNISKIKTKTPSKADLKKTPSKTPSKTSKSPGRVMAENTNALFLMRQFRGLLCLASLRRFFDSWRHSRFCSRKETKNPEWRRSVYPLPISHRSRTWTFESKFFNENPEHVNGLWHKCSKRAVNFGPHPRCLDWFITCWVWEGVNIETPYKTDIPSIIVIKWIPPFQTQGLLCQFTLCLATKISFFLIDFFMLNRMIGLR